MGQVLESSNPRFKISASEFINVISSVAAETLRINSSEKGAQDYKYTCAVAIECKLQERCDGCTICGTMPVCDDIWFDRCQCA